MSENIYDKARAVLRERGRTSCQYADPDGRVCLVGAIAVANGTSVVALQGATYPQVDRNVVFALSSVIREQFPEFGLSPTEISITAWNDSRDTTDADVDLVLDKAARAFDERVQS